MLHDCLLSLLLHPLVSHAIIIVALATAAVTAAAAAAAASVYECACV